VGCQDLSPHWQFVPWTFLPALDILPHGRFPMDVSLHGNGGNVLRPLAPKMFHPPHVHGANRLWANRPHGEMSSAGRNVHGANCQLGEKSINSICVLLNSRNKCGKYTHLWLVKCDITLHLLIFSVTCHPSVHLTKLLMPLWRLSTSKVSLMWQYIFASSAKRYSWKLFP